MREMQGFNSSLVSGNAAKAEDLNQAQMWASQVKKVVVKFCSVSVGESCKLHN